MRYASLGLLIAGLLAVNGVIIGQDKKDAPTAKAKGGQLPQGWVKANLGLTDDQKNKILAVDAKVDEEIDALTKKIADLKKKKKEDQLAVLTAEQKKKLEDYIKENAGLSK